MQAELIRRYAFMSYMTKQASELHELQSQVMDWHARIHRPYILSEKQLADVMQTFQVKFALIKKPVSILKGI